MVRQRGWGNTWTGLLALCSAALLLPACGGDDDAPQDASVDATTPADASTPDATPRADGGPFPECEGQEMVPLSGGHPMVISFFEIGAADEGFDLDGDSTPDNKMSAMGTLARGAIEDAFEQFELIVLLEWFDFPAVAADTCVKLALYDGHFKNDGDGDGALTSELGGDCNDSDDAIPATSEVAGNSKDDDCDGLADETIGGPSGDTSDTDGDGATILAGDCDDTEPAVLGPTAAEVCGDGLDNDCDGVADFGTDGLGDPECTPYDLGVPDSLSFEPDSLDGMGLPLYAFPDGVVNDVAGLVSYAADAGRAKFSIPLADDVALELRITQARIVGDLLSYPGGTGVANGRLGGVLNAQDLDSTSGLEVTEIGATPDDSLLDVIFANLLGTLIGLPRVTTPFGDCLTPDIDVDGDGLEAFCDSDPLDDTHRVDVCIDGDGTVVMDTKTIPCTDDPRFADGISIEVNFEAVPALLTSP